VTAQDCVASLMRWQVRDSMGQKLADSLKEYRVIDERTLAIVLKERFGPLLEAIGKPSVVVPFMMPKRVAETDPFQQISDYTGSGPFMLLKDEWKPGVKVVYVRNPNYKPSAEPPSGLAGSKLARLDRIEWTWIPAPQTQVNALLSGEIDMIESVAFDLLPLLEKDKGVRLIRGCFLQSVRFPHELVAPSLQRRQGAPGGIRGAAPAGFPGGRGRQCAVLAHVQGPVHMRLPARNRRRDGWPARGQR